MNRWRLVLLNTLTLLAVLFLNYLGSTGVLTGQTVGQIGHELDTLFTPADYAFLIWGFIYLWLLAFVGYQWHALVKRRDEEVVDQAGVWLLLANVFNGLWVLVWLYEHPGLSVIIMLALLFSLIQLVLRLGLETWNAPARIIVFVWWPVSFYFGWIILATVANISAFLVSVGWNGEPFTQEIWAIVMIIVATSIYLLLIQKRYMREAAMVGVWGLVAIAYRHWDVHGWIALTAIIAALVLVLVAVRQGYKYRLTNPLWMRGKRKQQMSGPADRLPG